MAKNRRSQIQSRSKFTTQQQQGAFSLEKSLSHSPFLFHFSGSLCLYLEISFYFSSIWLLVLLLVPFNFSPEQKVKVMFRAFSQCLLADLPTLSLTHTPDTEVFPSRLAPHTRCSPIIPNGFALFLLLMNVTSSLCSFPSSGDRGQGWLRCSSLPGLARPPPPA